ncbi:hypothetical protein [Ochrobactrum sp. EDr1-4]|uniref:hypothetical protein n=1 Tax=Ochrobactrum sp. EDr1-4 TaxID=3368622 RepID=UPI003BA3D481
MKTPNRNVVVEYKNRRSRKDSASLWGNLDLKSIAEEVDALIVTSPAESDAVQPSSKKNDVETTSKLAKTPPRILSVKEDIAEAAIRDDISVVDTVAITATPVPTPPVQIASEKAEARGVVEKKPSQARNKKAAQPNERVIERVSSDDEIRAELSHLEMENTDLKRELSTKLRKENQALLTMFKRLEIRTRRKI